MLVVERRLSWNCSPSFIAVHVKKKLEIIYMGGGGN